MRKRLLHMDRCRGIGRRSIRKFIRSDPSLKSIYEMTPSQISTLFAIPQQQASIFHKDLHNPALIKHIHSYLKNISVITIVDDLYPYVLKTIKDAPLVLYAIGNTHLLRENPLLSIVGTRRPSSKAMIKMKEYVLPLINYDWIIVSGMATGIDGYAHQLTINKNGKTIAVMGSGFNHIYPKEHTALFQQIAKYGLALSEYPPDIPPARYHFPERNRIISGLSFGTFVIEAKTKSGTLITVDQALDQGREVYALPGSPLEPSSSGCNRMIQDGAKLVQDHEDIAEDWRRIKTNWFI